MILENIALDCGPIRSGNNTSHIRIKDVEIRNSGVSAINTSGDYDEIINVHIHDVGGHGFYIGGRNVLIEGSRIHHTGSPTSESAQTGDPGYGIQVRAAGIPTENFVIRNNTIYDNRLGGIVLAHGGNHLVYNNIIYGNAGGILVGTGGNKIFNNTLVNNRYGISVNVPAPIEVRNNIIYGNGSTIDNPDPSLITQSNNLFTDPKFVNPSTNDFHLQSTSPASTPA